MDEEVAFSFYGSLLAALTFGAAILDEQSSTTRFSELFQFFHNFWHRIAFWSQGNDHGLRIRTNFRRHFWSF